MRILLLGSGGREHALALALSKDPAVHQLHVAPGNPGLDGLAVEHDVDICDAQAVVELARRCCADLVVVGPEAPLTAGVADAVRQAGIDTFGPGAAAAQLEGSKAFAKEVMAAAGVPTAEFRVCDTVEEAAAALDEFGTPYVVKNDALAGGKGVVVTSDRDAALAHARECGRVVVEEFLDGPEVSLFAICDGTRALPLLPAQDYKRVGDADTGANTGGMGAYCPLPWAPPGLTEEIMRDVVWPTLEEMRRRGRAFVGLLYAGLALTSNGPRVVEFNARFGDPETQAVLALLRSPLGRVLHAAARGELDTVDTLDWSDASAVVVVCAASGYPERPRLGGQVRLPRDRAQSYVLHAGTRREGEGLVASGGRVVSVVGTGPDLANARSAAYSLLAEVEVDQGFHRTDIGIPH